MTDPFDWRLRGSKSVYEGYVRVRRDTYELPGGVLSDWDVQTQSDTVAVVAFTATFDVVLFEQFRVGPARAIVEIPGGAVDEGETPVEAAVRELEEETGYRPGAVFHAGWEWSGANSTRRKHVVVAVDGERVGEPSWGDHEMGVVHLRAASDLLSHLLSGELSDAGGALRALHVFAEAAVTPGPLRTAQARVRDLLVPGPVVDAPGDAWSRRVADLWARADDDQPDELRRAMGELVRELGEGDPEALFERASVEDFLGEEAAAIPLYRAALDAGLDGTKRTQACIQLASSLRNVGDASGAMAVLRHVDAADPLAPAAHAFLALALHDDDKPTPALRTALGELAPHLPAYRRAVSAYAAELPARRRIRAIAVGLLVRDGWVLAEQYGDLDDGGFLRAPGGGIDIGERAVDAMHREIREELGATLTDATLLDVVENIYDRPGHSGHEVAFVFGIRSDELEALPRARRIDVLDGDTSVGWYRIADLRSADVPFHPVGMLDHAERLG
ncbi:tetratricopeptide repeat protein [Microbacterium dauci]|uniref:Tetratricopeptide repeat protein n=1 Tax=Microbacterium dauci TaxID=3048008 RepID=A0ABT6ZDF8_9MICO|nr:tetratricopeptide repeat protein [Microbacterium sp. LX3-4]MDJ1113760.1 tetratricopeptide repeat protein [Microbacterium sp. LX3-4]